MATAIVEEIQGAPDARDEKTWSQLQQVLDRALNERRILQLLAEEFGFSDEFLAEIVGCNKVTIKKWRDPEQPEAPGPGKKHAEAVQQLRAVTAILVSGRAFVAPTDVSGWFRQLNRELSWKTPAEVLREGRVQAVIDAAQEFMKPGSGSDDTPLAGFGAPGELELLAVENDR